MSDIKQAGEEMSLAYKQLEAAWKAATERLITAHCPYECAVVVSDSDDDFAKLAWAKLSSKWHMHFRRERSGLRPLTVTIAEAIEVTIADWEAIVRPNVPGMCRNHANIEESAVQIHKPKTIVVRFHFAPFIAVS